MRTLLASYSLNGTSALYRWDHETGIVELLLVPAGMEEQVAREDCAPEPLVQAKIVGDDYAFGFTQGRTLRGSATVSAMRFAGQRHRVDGGAWHDVLMGESISSCRSEREDIPFCHPEEDGVPSCHPERSPKGEVEGSHPQSDDEILRLATLAQDDNMGNRLAQDDNMGNRLAQDDSVEGCLAREATTAARSIEVATTLTDARGYEYTHTLRMGADSRAVEITTSFANHSDEAVTLELLSSFTLGSLSPFATGLAPETMVLHRLRSTWSAEGRLVSEPIEDEQLEPSWQNFSANSIRFGSVGSFPVRGWVPFVALEDTASGVTWAAATTQASSWQIEVSRRDMGLSLSGGIADREFGHWTRVVAPGERFDAPYAVVAVGTGGVDGVSQQVAGNVRHRLDLPECEESMPVIFNEFCTTWGVPTERSVDEQIDFLSRLKTKDGKGVGYFVIDAGWFDDKAFEAASHFGSWEPSAAHFPHGLKPVVDKVHAAGIKAGLWFEFEIAGREDPDCFNRTSWLLSRDGVSITAGNRRWWDMRNPAVRAYLKARVIDLLKVNGFDYVKVDYNDSIGIGCETPRAEAGNPESLGDGLYEQILASQEFFREMKREVPGLVVEVCASGGHRLAQSFMEIGSMASFSDAHEQDEIPVIAANMHRMIEPRQSQIWAVVKRDQPLSKLYYQVASGLLGRLCFSGDTETLRLEQQDVMRQAIAWYAKAAPVIDHGESHWFGPKVASYRHPRGWQAVVRVGKPGTPAEGRTLVVIHTFHDAPETIELPVAGHIADTWARPGLSVATSDTADVTGADTGTLTITGLTDFDGLAILFDN